VLTSRRLRARREMRRAMDLPSHRGAAKAVTAAEATVTLFIAAT